MSEIREREIQLPAGASLCIRLRRGSVVVIRRGRVVLRPAPEWLAESLVGAEVDLGAEERHLVVASGNIGLTAIRSAEVAVIPASPWPCFQWPWWRQFLRRGPTAVVR